MISKWIDSLNPFNRLLLGAFLMLVALHLLTSLCVIAYWLIWVLK